MKYPGCITHIDGLKAGHATDIHAKTGCTVILCPPGGAVAGVCVRGAAPGTRETDLLDSCNTVERIHAVLLAGGSAFGLAAADGVMRFLEEQGIGLDVGVAKVPIVPAAVLFDLGVGDPNRRPDSAMGYEAATNASQNPLPQGPWGAGTGATVGKALGMEHAMPGGIGCACLALPGGLLVAACVAVNAVGDVTDPDSGRILAGARKDDGSFLDTRRFLLQTSRPGTAGANTTIGVIATNANLTKAMANRLASVAHDGLATAIRPVHTPMDGDTLFCLSCGGLPADMTMLGVAASQVAAMATVNAVTRGQAL